MKYLDRLINFIFSIVILILSIVVIMVSAGFIGYESVDNWMRLNMFSEANNTITCIVAIVTFLLALKTTVFLSRMSPKKKNTILVDTNHGKIQIVAETIEGTARSVVKDIDEIKDVQVRMIKEKKGVKIYMVLLVLPTTNIMELSAMVQDEVKKAIEDTTGVKVNNVDIKIKNIADARKAKKLDKENQAEIVNSVENIENTENVENVEVQAVTEENIVEDNNHTEENDII